MVKIKRQARYLFRAVSEIELRDIREHGLRIKPGKGGYVFGKLFALSYNDAVEYGKIVSFLDGLETTVIKVFITQAIFNKSDIIEADGMDAILVEKEYLTLLKVVEDNF